jgi:hypothetical protein
MTTPTTTCTPSSTCSENPHPMWLRRRVQDNRLINTFRQSDPEAVGLGNPHSQLIQRVSAHRPSIVDRLAARSVTGQSLDILVHQHFGYRVHLEWNGGNSSRESYRFMERRFLMDSDTQTFCVELCKFGLEGLCTCIYGDYHKNIPAKTPRCQRGPFYPTQKYLQKPRWWVKSLEEDWGEKKIYANVQFPLLPH